MGEARRAAAPWGAGREGAGRRTGEGGPRAYTTRVHYPANHAPASCPPPFFPHLARLPLPQINLLQIERVRVGVPPHLQPRGRVWDGVQGRRVPGTGHRPTQAGQLAARGAAAAVPQQQPARAPPTHQPHLHDLPHTNVQQVNGAVGARGRRVGGAALLDGGARLGRGGGRGGRRALVLLRGPGVGARRGEQGPGRCQQERRERGRR